MLFDLYLFPKESGTTLCEKTSEKMIGTIEGRDIHDVAYDLLCSAKEEIRSVCGCDSVEADYEMPSELFSPDDKIDYSICAVAYDKKKQLTGKFIFGIRKAG